jgi:hypothetical protein
LHKAKVVRGGAAFQSGQVYWKTAIFNQLTAKKLLGNPSSAIKRLPIAIERHFLSRQEF